MPLSRTAEKSLDVDALRSGTLACFSLPPPRSMQCTSTSSGGPTKPRPKPITRLKMPWMQLSIVQGTFSDPAIHWENIRREETIPLGKYLAKRSTGKIFGEKKSIGKISATFLLRSPVQRSNCTRQCNSILNLALILPPWNAIKVLVQLQYYI